MNNTLVVLDFSTAVVHIVNLPREEMQVEEVEDFIEDMGLRVNDCQFMFGANLSIEDDR